MTANFFQSSMKIEITKQFQFSSSLQRMSVVVKASDSRHYRVFCKGSPETIIKLSKNSTVPENLSSRITDFTAKGYRVIAMATKVIEEITSEELDGLNREEVEMALNFIGLLVFENKLKAETTGVIYTLKNAKIKVVMITGELA